MRRREPPGRDSMNDVIDRRRFLRVFVNPLRSMGSRPETAIDSSTSRIAVLDASLCMATAGSDCRVCLAACPEGDRALALDDGVLAVIPLGCTGCGVCVPACEAVAAPPALRLIPRVY